MNLRTRFGSGTAAIGAAVLGGIVLIGGAIGFSVVQNDPDASEPDAVVLELAEDATDPPEVIEVETEEWRAPRLDVVRVDPTGTAVVAGSAPAEMSLQIMLQGEEIAEATPDAAGDFVALVTVPPSDQPRTLTVLGHTPDGQVISGAETVLVAPFDAPVPDVVEATEPVPDIETPAVAEDVSETPVVVADAVPETPVAENAEGPDVEAAPELVVAAQPEPTVSASELLGDRLLAEADTDAEPETDEANTATNPTLTASDTPSSLDPAPERWPSPRPVESGEILAETTEPDPDSAVQPPEPAAGTEIAEVPPVAAPDATPSLPPGPRVASAGPTLGTPAPDAADPLTPIAQAPSDDRATPTAPTLIVSGPDGLRVAQSPGAQPEVQTSVRLDVISYDADGAVTLAGRGPAASGIQIYLNNQPIQMGEVGPGGAWSLDLPDVDPGTYTLSVAELGPDGREESRIETPFLREDPERIANVPARAAADGVEVLTVQPDMTLWGIANDTFGDGILYVQIFEENRDQIRDPHWIFPGQIFRLPDLPRAEAGVE